MYQVAQTDWPGPSGLNQIKKKPMSWEHGPEAYVEIITPGFEQFLSKVPGGDIILRGIDSQFERK